MKRKGAKIQIRESVTPKSRAQAAFNALLPLGDFLPFPIRESVTSESQIVETATPQLIYGQLCPRCREMWDSEESGRGLAS